MNFHEEYAGEHHGCFLIFPPQALLFEGNIFDIMDEHRWFLITFESGIILIISFYDVFQLLTSEVIFETQWRPGCFCNYCHV